MNRAGNQDRVDAHGLERPEVVGATHSTGGDHLLRWGPFPRSPQALQGRSLSGTDSVQRHHHHPVRPVQWFVEQLSGAERLLVPRVER